MTKPVGEDELRAVLDAFNRHDLDGILGHFSDDAVFESPRGPDPWGTRFVGREAVRAGLAKRFEGIPDVHYGDDSHFVSADGARGASEWTLTGTTTDGERIEVRGCDLWTFEGGRIVRKDSYWKRSSDGRRRRARVAIVGAGAWGTTLAVLVAKVEPVLLLAHDRDAATRIDEARENARRLPGIRLPDSVRVVGRPGAI